MEIGTDVFSTP